MSNTHHLISDSNEPLGVNHHRKRLEQLEQLGCQYAYYFRWEHGVIRQSNAETFVSASLIKVPVLLAWLVLEREGLVDRNETCRLDDLTQVQGAGIAWQMKTRLLPYADLLLMMIALSDNLATNLVIERAGMERLNQVFHSSLGLTGTHLQRRMMDMEARRRGLENTISAADAVHLYELIRALPAAERAWVDELLLACLDEALLLRNLPRDTVQFHHKTGSIRGVLHDWGYTSSVDCFLLTNQVKDEPPVFQAFGQLGEWIMQPPAQPLASDQSSR